MPDMQTLTREWLARIGAVEDLAACAICQRVRCPQRAAAPAARTLTVNETRKTISPVPFLGG